ncbi:MAG TPA: helix-turn-helix domain-containing protein [Polyangia bacterium]|jgi:AcrR family transcriptional regulator|nr:helix-turn-helix domain-containing protein [Polyangia bacterium]
MLRRRLTGVGRRRSNVQRSAEMQNRILRATIDCLVKHGYAAMTTTIVADRAAVSRGAFLHHFRTKEDLVLAAVQHLFDLRNAEFRAAFARVPANADRPAAALDLLWRIIGGDTFYAWVELAVAGRTDERLGQKVRELGSRTALAVETTFRDIFPRPATPNPFYDHAPRFAFALLQGLALDRLLVDSPRVQAEEILTLIKRLAVFAIPPGGQP